MATDPSWLYSTIAQSSATIVAIIGGFITANVLNLLSEKRSIEKQISEKDTLTKIIKDKKKELNDIYETNEAEWFLKKELTKYPDNKIPTLEEIFADYPSDYKEYFNIELLKKEYNKLSSQKIKAKFFVFRHSDKIDANDYNKFLEWAKRIVSTQEYAEIVDQYDKYLERQKKWETASPEARTIPPWAMQSINRINQNQIENEQKERKLEEESFQSRQHGILNEIEKLDNQLYLLNHELENLNSQSRSFSYPPNLKMGAYILGFLAVFGIIAPVIIIANEAFYNWAKWLVTGPFWIGIIGVFAYIVFQISTLRRK